MSAELIIYTKTGCPYCAAAKKHYTNLGRTFTEINITENPSEKANLLKLSEGMSMVPVIVDNGQVQLGFGGG